MKHESDFLPNEADFGKLPEAPLPMPKQTMAKPLRLVVTEAILRLFGVARSGS